MAVCSSARHSTSTRLPPDLLDPPSAAAQPWCEARKRDIEQCHVFSACGRAMGNKEEEKPVPQLNDVLWVLVFFAPGNKKNRWILLCSSLLIMLESQLHFYVTNLFVFVCCCCQIIYRASCRTDPSSQSPALFSVSLASHHFQLARLSLPLLSYPPLSVKLCFSHSPYRSLESLLCFFKTSSVLFCAGTLPHDLLEDSFHLCADDSQCWAAFHRFKGRMLL